MFEVARADGEVVVCFGGNQGARSVTMCHAADDLYIVADVDVHVVVAGVDVVDDGDVDVTLHNCWLIVGDESPGTTT